MDRAALYYVSNLLLVLYLFSAIYAIMTKSRDAKLRFGAISGLLFGLAMGIILFWLPSSADPSAVKKSALTLLLMSFSLTPCLFIFKLKKK